jgi:hypothetical protein
METMEERSEEDESHELIDSVRVFSFLLCEPGMHFERNKEIG